MAEKIEQTSVMADLAAYKEFKASFQRFKEEAAKAFTKESGISVEDVGSITAQAIFFDRVRITIGFEMVNNAEKTMYSGRLVFIKSDVEPVKVIEVVYFNKEGNFGREPYRDAKDGNLFVTGDIERLLIHALCCYGPAVPVVDEKIKEGVKR